MAAISIRHCHDVNNKLSGSKRGVVQYNSSVAVCLRASPRHVSSDKHRTFNALEAHACTCLSLTKAVQLLRSI